MFKISHLQTLTSTLTASFRDIPNNHEHMHQQQHQSFHIKTHIIKLPSAKSQMQILPTTTLSPNAAPVNALEKLLLLKYSRGRTDALKPY
jgi:hypothetical protein